MTHAEFLITQLMLRGTGTDVSNEKLCGLPEWLPVCVELCH